MNLKNASVIGFFSIPSPSLAEHNPNAYNNAMASMPTNAGTCANCGMGIRHHVVIRLEDGSQAFIGSDCAQRVGDDIVRRCVRERMTAEQLTAREAIRDERRKAFLEEIAQRDALIARRAEAFADILPALEDAGSSFLSSLASQLRESSLSFRQAECVAKTFFGRRVKKNAVDFDAFVDRLTIDSREFDKTLLETANL